MRGGEGRAGEQDTELKGRITLRRAELLLVTIEHTAQSLREKLEEGRKALPYKSSSHHTSLSYANQCRKMKNTRTKIGIMEGHSRKKVGFKSGPTSAIFCRN